jgi:hypothetical protein
LVFWNYSLWVGTRPWATLDSLITGRRYPLTQDVANIGRPAQNVRHLIRQVELRAQPVSRIHMMIFRNDYAIDMRSLYGTTVNGEFLPYGDQKQLTDGDVIVLAGAAGFRFHQLAYQPWQFFWDPPPSHDAQPAGWGLLIDSKRRLVFPLTQDQEFIAAAGKTGVEPGGGPEGAIAIVRRLDSASEAAYSVDNLDAELFLHLPEDPGPATIQLVSFADPGTADYHADRADTSFTIEDEADGAPLQADLKLDDYSYGRFVVPEGKQSYVLVSRGNRQQTIAMLAFHQGERRFQVIALDPTVESPNSESAD